MKIYMAVLLTMGLTVSLPGIVRADDVLRSFDIPFEQFRSRQFPKDGDIIRVWTGEEKWPGDQDIDQRREYTDIAYGRLIRSHPNDRNDQDQAWIHPGVVARDGYIEIRAGWRHKLDGHPGSPHFDGMFRAKVYLEMIDGKIQASVQDVEATHRGSNLFFTAANLFGGKIDIAKRVEAKIKEDLPDFLSKIDQKIDQDLKDHPRPQSLRNLFSIDILGSEPPPKAPRDPSEERSILESNRPDVKGGAIRISILNPFAPQSTTPRTGQWCHVRSARTGLYLDVRDYAIKNNADICQSTRDDKQVWRLIPSEKHPGYFHVEFKTDNDYRYLDVYFRNQDEGGRICLASHDPDQVWKPVPTEKLGYYSLQSFVSDQYLDVYFAKPYVGWPISQVKHPDRLQVWRFEPAK